MIQSNYISKAANNWRNVFVLTVVASILCWPYFTRVKAAAGDLDPTFGNGGKVTVDFSDRFDEGNALVIQPDGKIVVAGSSIALSLIRSSIVVARYNRDGSLDSGFGSGGSITTRFGELNEDAAIALQTDGKIIVAGSTRSGFGDFSDFAVAPYNSDGSLDRTFGAGGKVTTALSEWEDQAFAMILQPDGKIIVGGNQSQIFEDENFALVRYNTNGSLDLSFGDEGKVITNLAVSESGSGSADSVMDIALDSLGRIIASGTSILPSSSSGPNTLVDFALARYNTDGSLDLTFGEEGKVKTHLGSFDDRADALLVQSDDKIILGGRTFTQDEKGSFALARYDTEGNLDESFGSNGVVVTSPVGASDIIRSLNFQEDGKIIAAGTSFNTGTHSNFIIARYLNDGTLDNTFGTEGRIVTDFRNWDDSLQAVSLQSDGKIIAAGHASTIDGSRSFALARYRNDITVPRINNASINGKKLFLDGEKFDDGARILLNGLAQKTQYVSANQLIAKKAGKKIKSGDRLQIQNSDGTLSNELIYP